MAEGFGNTTALVTGAQGFIGCWLAERLLDEGARVVVPRRSVVPRSRFRREGIEERCVIVDVDVIDHRAMSRALAEHRVDLVFHLAAQPIVGIANRSPYSTWESNVRGTYALLEACRTVADGGGASPRVIVASSDHAYGDHEELPYREDFAFRALYPYDVSKACADIVARSYAEAAGLPVAVTRMANTFGGGDLNWSRIVPDTSRALVRGQRPVIRSDGTPERDYLYVEDAVAAYLAVARSLDDPANHGAAWNVGMGQPVSVLELVETLIDASGNDVEPEVRGPTVPPAEIDRLYPDSTAIRGRLDWAPTRDLRSGLEVSYRWYERYLSGEAASFVADVA
jgi:CDP-glucose 4,6-dehydratase